jgi:ketosteroid isomerase-like protein
MDDEARETIERFHEALNRRDLDALADLITADCVFEATSPAPDGTRHVGRQAVLEACRDFFAGSSSVGSTPGPTGTSAVLTCCGSGLGR